VKSTLGIVEIGPNDALGAPRSLGVIKPARFTRNYPVFAGLQLPKAEQRFVSKMLDNLLAQHQGQESANAA